MKTIYIAEVSYKKQTFDIVLMRTTFKYQKHFDQCGLTSCPPTECLETQRPAFRWCYNPLEDERNFMPQAIKMEKKIIPPRRNARPAKMCADFAISLFDTASNAKQEFKSLPSNTKALLGYTHLSQTDLTFEDGVMSRIEENGHFNFHEYANSAFLERCVVVDNLA